MTRSGISSGGSFAGIGKTAPTAAIFGCSGTKLTVAEKRFFADVRPVGLILFARNCREPEQVRELVAAFRKAVGRADAPVLIDQEGGRVQRLNPPHWRAAPAAAAFADLARRDRALAIEAVGLNARLIAAELAELGITVNCAPVLDVPQPDAHRVIGDRAFGDDAQTVAALGTAACEGFLAHGILPVIKHIPGHGRALADSHQALPRVAADEKALAAVDFAPFRALQRMPWAMTAHVVYEALDRDHPATTSARVIAKAIRGAIGFEGVLVSDDIGMKALAGPFDKRAASALAAGCDLVLHCSGVMAEMRAVAAGTGPISADAAARLKRGEAMRRKPGPWDKDAAKARLDEIMAANAMA
ncbi:MAG TPA: beta-N-acetylhexosaminidase [Rhodospirillales bacterium]